MSQITLVRHGQANTGARDEASYDKLSDLGHQQSRWLGDHLRATGYHYPRVFSGTLTRHVETAQSMGFADSIVQDPRLNEMQYFSLAKALEEQFGEPIPTEREDFADNVVKVFSAWSEGRIAQPYETWSDFQARTQAALQEIAAGEGPALVVTSGGVVGMIMQFCLDLDPKATARIVLATMNSSLHRLYIANGVISPDLFNAVPHLEAQDRRFAQTHL
ncbi:histidine phosphatase family protein [Epibacterium ulvae]|uniref:histidine phosphatase family protein n=1 Tax=Epibacterium ulvae TaxID=1156985 RepID=UPI001BFC0EEB|nr:histidine phosphatase family protein [Epibacterium ulvae]MBT8155076.1 histidine phosphatase family protein [Epibacterium ulvae]